MVQLYQDGADRKIEVSHGQKLLKVTFTPNHAHLENKASEVKGTLFEAGPGHTVKAALLSEASGKGETEKEALLDFIVNLSKEATRLKKDSFVIALGAIKARIIAEGLGFSKPRYIPHSQRS